MRTSRIVALAALLALSGCNLVLDQDGVKPTPKVDAVRRGACVKAATGHQVCGGSISAGAASASAPGGHRATQGRVDAGAVARMTSPQFQALHSRITP